MIFAWIRIPCSRAHQLLSERLDRPITSNDRWRLRLRAHLLICAVCTKVGKQMDFMRQAIRQLDR